jgi:hypothetical protein
MNSHTVMGGTPEALLLEVVDEAAASLKVGRRNYLADFACSVGAVGGSYAAAVLATLDWEERWILAAFAAFPGLCVALQRVADFRGRATWYLSRATAYGLCRGRCSTKVSHYRKPLHALTKWSGKWMSSGRESYVIGAPGEGRTIIPIPPGENRIHPARQGKRPAPVLEDLHQIALTARQTAAAVRLWPTAERQRYIATYGKACGRTCPFGHKPKSSALLVSTDPHL